MSTKENKELVRQNIKEWNALNGDVAKMRSISIMHQVSSTMMSPQEI